MGPTRRRLATTFTAAACLLASTTVGDLAARADTRPGPGVPATVSADALPTWQLNGVVWSQVVVGHTVYATGKFTKARPPGVRPGGSGEVSANHVFAYDIRTGKRVGSFNHQMNGQGLTVAASPDGRRVYVGGEFTKVDGKTRNRVAAFDTATHQLLPFAPSADRAVRALAVSASTVYLGGSFTRVSGKVRNRLAALTPAGALTDWAPSADDYSVRAMVLAPDGGRLIVGGSFTTLNGVPAYGMGSLDVTTGLTLPWAANLTIRDAGVGAWITSLRTDGSQIYGSGFQLLAAKTGNFEGTFSADPVTGRLNWVNNCHGDTYDVLPVGPVLYSVGHAHDCSAIGEFDDTVPVTEHRALASPIVPTTVNRPNLERPTWLYTGLPAANHLAWLPTLSKGSFTGQNQAAWSLAGNESYIALGGEFPKVNGVAQQSLVRFAVAPLAPRREGPSSDFAPAVTSPAPGVARLSWTSVWDRDNQSLVYRVYRDGASTPVGTYTRQSLYWDRPAQTHLDAAVPAGRHTYVVKATDPDGNTSTTGPVAVTVAGLG